MFLPKEAGVSGNYKEKESQKPHPKLKIYIYILTFCIEYLFCLQSNTNTTFLQICIDFEEQRLKFSHSESSIIP